MTPREEAQRWRRQAEADLRTANKMFTNSEFGACSFYSQQAAEKSLKALLYAKGIRMFGHSLAGLLGRLTDEGFSEPDNSSREAAKALDEHYISARYPDAFESKIPDDEYTAEMAREALQWAQALMRYSGENLASLKNESEEEKPSPNTPND
ncbi:MAG: HEPN domain-containing protein [Chloroflexi bacterium]|nr:HEPN domain-containing protein [Chloroflexota bacterium]